MKRHIAAVALLLPILFPLQGCKGKWTVSTNASCSHTFGGSTSCTVGGGVSYSPQAVGQSIVPSDLSSVSDGSYTLSMSVPSSAFKPDPNGTGTTTITATTDTGYSSSITLNLTPVAAAVSPVNSGDTVYSYNLPVSAALNVWIARVQANTTSTLTVQSSAGLPFVSEQEGTFTSTAVVTSNATGTSNAGEVTTPIGPNPNKPTCKPGMVCSE